MRREPLEVIHPGDGLHRIIDPVHALAALHGILDRLRIAERDDGAGLQLLPVGGIVFVHDVRERLEDHPPEEGGEKDQQDDEEAAHEAAPER